MLELDEWDELLVNNFTQDALTEESSLPFNANEPDDNTLVSVTIDSSECHPLRSRSVSPSTYRGAQTKPPSVTVTSITSTEGETRPRLTRLVVGSSNDEGSVEGDGTNARDEPQVDSDPILHKVSARDSLAGVALRYGVSIAALRRANQLWPSDPIHLRTELIIPRGDTLHVRSKPINSLGADAVTTSIVEPVPGSSSDFMTSTVVAARSIILSVLPARLSMESLSSKTTTSEDHELDDLQTARARKLSADEGPFFEGAHELASMAVPLSRDNRSSIPPLSQLPCVPVDNHVQSSIYLVGDPHRSSSSSSSAGSLVRSRRTQPSAIFLPVRTSQLEPEPAMELPVRRSRS